MIYREAGNGVLLAFPTIVVRREVPNSTELNPAIAAYLREDRAKSPSPSTSSVKGWQSGRDLTTRNQPALNRLFPHIGTALLDVCSEFFGFRVAPNECGVMAEAWGNIQSKGDFTAIHNHVSGNDWSGVYYVDVGDGPDNGILELIDPRTVQELTGPGKFRRPNRELTIRPRNGLLVVWPSWMKHVVYPLDMEGERISIAFNAKIRLEDRN